MVDKWTNDGGTVEQIWRTSGTHRVDQWNNDGATEEQWNRHGGPVEQ